MIHRICKNIHNVKIKDKRQDMRRNRMNGAYKPNTGNFGGMTNISFKQLEELKFRPIQNVTENVKAQMKSNVFFLRLA